jgi:hypothetical protein
MVGVLDNLHHIISKPLSIELLNKMRESFKKDWYQLITHNSAMIQ